MKNKELIQRLCGQRRLLREEWQQLFSAYTEEDLDFAMEKAREIALKRFGKAIYFRGIIEFTNFCRNDCFYCGIRCSNREASRYRLTGEDILICCQEGYESGFRTFVLQGGEDGYFTDERLCAVVGEIHERYPDCAVTLSVGERSRESYERLYAAGATRYLLRHETASQEHYRELHPASLSLEHRMNCLRDLKDIGYQTGCGFMVGTPGQKPEHLAADMEFITELQPQMVGIGPFIPHSQTPFGGEQKGSVDTTLLSLALCRILLPEVLLPSTTALGTAEADGRKRGVLAGCNVVMPNLSPMSVRKKYLLYDNKAGVDMTPEQGVRALRKQMEEIGYKVIVGKGDYRKDEAND